jgi:hypothetical protein
VAIRKEFIKKGGVLFSLSGICFLSCYGKGSHVMKFVVDESVSYAVVEKLRELEYEVISVAKDYTSLKDQDVYKLADQQAGKLQTGLLSISFRCPLIIVVIMVIIYS